MRSGRTTLLYGEFFLRFASAFCAALAVAALAACNSTSSSTPSPTPTPSTSPSPGAVSVTTSPSPFTLSVTGAAGVPHIGTFTVSQSGATGNLVLSTTSTPACYNSVAPSGSDLVQLESVAQNYSSTTATAQLTFTLNSLNAGTCSVTITPASGTAVTVPVTVNP